MSERPWAHTLMWAVVISKQHEEHQKMKKDYFNVEEYTWDETGKELFKPMFDSLKKILNKSNPRVLEIGAHHGQDTIRFCKTFEDLDIYCFEPCEDNCYILNKVVAQVADLIPEFNGSVSVIKRAVCDKHNKKLILYRPLRTPAKTIELKNRTNSLDPMHDKKQSGWISGNLFMDEGDIKDIYFGADGCSLNKIIGTQVPTAEEVVETITLDGWDEQQNNEFYDLAWIDVQGAEKKVLSGATNTLKKINYVYIEHSQHIYEGALSRSATIEFMNKRGFEYYIDIDEDNLLFAKTPGRRN